MNYETNVWVGILLIVLAGLALAYQGFDYTRQEKILDVGQIHATAEGQKHVSIPPCSAGWCWLPRCVGGFRGVEEIVAREVALRFF